VAKPLIIQQGWLLSHTVRFLSHTRHRRDLRKSRNRIEKPFARVIARFSFGDQLAAGFGFLALCDLALTGFRELAGRMLSGLPATTGVTAASGSGSGLKNARHCGLSCDLLRIMQTVTRSTSGISGPQSRNASPLQACCSSGV
jgi:hypothetical protein